MQLISIIILIWIYAISVTGFLYVFSDLIGLSTSPMELSFLLALFGVGLGFIFYGLSFLKTQIKNYAILGTMGLIFLMILITYISFGISTLSELLLLLLKIGFFLSMCSVPIVGVYGIMIKQKNAIKTSATGILFLYFFILILSKITSVFAVPFYSVEEILKLLLFFIFFIIYLELGVNLIYFDSVMRKMSPTQDNDEFMFARFNQVVNRYLLQVPTVLMLVYIISLMFFWNSDFFSTHELFGVSLTSGFGIFLLIVLTVAGTFLFWYLIPREKTKVT